MEENNYLDDKLPVSYRDEAAENLRKQLKSTISYIGELNIFSLNKIKNKISTMKVNPIIKERFIANLAKENKISKPMPTIQQVIDEYEILNECSSYGVSAYQLIRAIEMTNEFLRGVGHAKFKNKKIDNLEERCKNLEKNIDSQNKIIKKWFGVNYYILINDDNKAIPDTLITSLKKDFLNWTKREHRFYYTIGDFIDSIAMDEEYIREEMGSYNTYLAPKL